MGKISTLKTKINNESSSQCGSVCWSIARYTKGLVGLIPSQDTYLCCEYSPLSGRIQEATDRCFSHIDDFPSLSLSLKSVDIPLGKD